ncbi:helicase-related protein [Sphingomonas sp. MMS24-JH45]
MFQAGEVDDLVATDAIGMGLNLDVGHVAFAGLTKFDGQRRRRLTVAEMAQIAGRAGRHQRDGTFGALAEEGPERVRARGSGGDRGGASVSRNWRPCSARCAPTCRRSTRCSPRCRAARTTSWRRPAPEALDVKVLKRLAEDPQVRARAKGQVDRLWAAWRVPISRSWASIRTRASSGRVFQYLSAGHVPAMVRRLGRAAGPHRGRRRDDRGAHLRDPQMGLYRAASRLVC